jgi:hypothetical protein
MGSPGRLIRALLRKGRKKKPSQARGVMAS